MGGMGYIYVIQFGILSIYLLKGSQPKRELPGLKGFQMVTESLVSLFLGHASCFPAVVLLKINRWCKLCKKILVTSQTNQTRHRIAIVHPKSHNTHVHGFGHGGTCSKQQQLFQEPVDKKRYQNT